MAEGGQKLTKLALRNFWTAPMRMCPYLAEKAKNLINAMLLSTEENSWDS